MSFTTALVDTAGCLTKGSYIQVMTWIATELKFVLGGTKDFADDGRAAGATMAGTILTATAEEPSSTVELETVESKVNTEVSSCQLCCW